MDGMDIFNDIILLDEPKLQVPDFQDLPMPSIWFGYSDVVKWYIQRKKHFEKQWEQTVQERQLDYQTEVHIRYLYEPPQEEAASWRRPGFVVTTREQPMRFGKILSVLHPNTNCQVEFSPDDIQIMSFGEIQAVPVALSDTYRFMTGDYIGLTGILMYTEGSVTVTAIQPYLSNNKRLLQRNFGTDKKIILICDRTFLRDNVVISLD